MKMTNHRLRWRTACEDCCDTSGGRTVDGTLKKEVVIEVLRGINGVCTPFSNPQWPAYVPALMNGHVGGRDHLLVQAEKFGKEIAEAIGGLERDLKHLKHLLAQNKPARLASENQICRRV